MAAHAVTVGLAGAAAVLRPAAALLFSLSRTDASDSPYQYNIAVTKSAHLLSAVVGTRQRRVLDDFQCDLLAERRTSSRV